jgi:hypothetical protein
MSDKNELTGRIIVLNDTQIFPSGYSKREFVIEETEGKYPQQIKFDAVKDGCDKLDAFSIGDVVTVAYNLRGNEYNGKYYVSLQAWKVTLEEAGERPPKPDAHNTAKGNAYQPQPEEDDTSIPF